MMHIKLFNTEVQREAMKMLKPHFGIANMNGQNKTNKALKLPVPAISTVGNWLADGEELFGERPNG